MMYIGYGAVFLSLSSVFFIFVFFLQRKRRMVKERLDRFVLNSDAKKVLARALDPAKGQADTLLGRQRDKSFKKHFRGLEKRLAQAHLFFRPMEYLLLVFIMGIFLGGILYIFSRILVSFVLGILMAILFGFLYLNTRKQKRLKKFNSQIVDMLGLVANGLRAGYSFLQSIEIVAREMQPPMSYEFTRMMRQVNLGLTVEEALKELLDRMESDDLDLVVTAILIQRQVGGNLSEIFDTISHTIRERIKLKNQVKVLTVQGKMSGIIISLLVPILGLVIFMLNPEFLTIMIREPIGIFMIFMAFILQVIGAYFIRKITGIEV